MKRISSKQTFFLKRIFPVAFVALAFAPLLLVYSQTGSFHAGAVAPAILIVFVLAVIYPKLIWNLADEVYDGGDYLLVKRGRLEERIALSDIMNVDSSVMVNPPRITLRLARPGKLGNEVVFSPVRPMTLNPFARSAIAEDLIVRVDAARVKRAKP
ncbi:MAG TPA: hypothetical protein VN598_08690 [Usitatibacter sp.]|nr:hypothetical protein [Usitatibacter sp.]